MSADSMIRAQAEEEQPDGPERPDDSMEDSNPCCSRDTVSSPHSLAKDKGKETDTCGRLSNYRNETK